MSSATIDALAAFEAEGEDREPDVDNEPSLGVVTAALDAERDMADDEPNGDDEPSIC